VVDLGHNYRIDEIRSALGLVQLHKLVRNNARRQSITARYRQGLTGRGYEGIELPFTNSLGQSSYHIFPLLLPKEVDRQAFMDIMRARGVQTSIHYPPIHLFSYYRQRYPYVSLPITETVAGREVTLPLFPGMKNADTDYVIDSVGEALSAAKSPAALSMPGSV
jgi:dTDP-4-amino-4,6-dideoxygalactose transaminase